MDKKLFACTLRIMITRCVPFAVLPAALDIADGSAKGFARSLPQRDKGRHQGASPDPLQGTWLQASPPRILDTCCNDREVFMEIYEELPAMGLEMEVEDETPADVVTQLHPPSTLAPLHSTHHTTEVHSTQRRAARTLQPRRECIWSPAGQQDREAPPSTGGVGRC